MNTKANLTADQIKYKLNMNNAEFEVVDYDHHIPNGFMATAKIENLHFAEEIVHCAKCGSNQFREYRTGREHDVELIYKECVECGAKFYSKNFFIQNVSVSEELYKLGKTVELEKKFRMTLPEAEIFETIVRKYRDNGELDFRIIFRIS